MADGSERRKLRGPYKEYVRHFNPYEFPAARRAMKRKLISRNRPQVNFSDTSDEDEEFILNASHENLIRDSDTASMFGDLLDVFAEDPSVMAEETNGISYETTCEQDDNEDACVHEDRSFGDEESFSTQDENYDLVLSDNDQPLTYQRFIKDDNSFSDGSSDNEFDSDLEFIIDDEGNEPTNTESDELLFSAAPITAMSSAVLLLSFVMRYKLTREAFKDLLAVIEAHCPRPNNCHTTVGKLLDFVSQAKSNIVKHFFCGYCKAYHGKSKANGNCHICGKHLAETAAHFIEVPIAKQLQNYFADSEFVDGLNYKFQRRKHSARNIEDVYDGSLYQRQCVTDGVLSEPYNISVKVNTDGVAIFRSSQFGVWPIFLLVNELPPTLRIKNKYRIFAGLWFGEEKPFFSTFLKPFVETLHETEIHGIDVVLPDGRKVNAKVIPLSGHFDLPARAAIVEQVTFTGHDSCCYCNEHGEVVKTSERGHVMTFPFRNTPTGHAEIRTADEVRVHSYHALESNSVVHGLKAPSPLLQLPSFDIFNGIAIDTMHCVFLGVVKQLIGLWFSSKHSGRRWYCGNSVGVVDKRLLGIKPPNVVTRVPRSIEHQIKFWKATEYRNWLFYYSLPCMKDVLDDELHQHYSLLVGGIYLLSGTSISPEQLEKAGKLLIHFVEMFDVYYDPRYVLMNHHMLLHLKKCVMDHGPLWTSSLFVFEDWNGDIGSYFHGTQNIASQIMTSVTSQQQLPSLVNKMLPGSAKDITLQLQGHCNRSNRTPLKQGFYAVGALKSRLLDPIFEDDLISALEIESLCTVKYFTRLQAENTVFHSRMYKRVVKRNSFTVAYRKEGTVAYGQVEAFFNVPGDLNATISSGAVVVPMSKISGSVCEQHEILEMPATHIVTVSKPNRLCSEIITLDDLLELCLYIEISDNDIQYVAHFPNQFEKD